MILSTFAFARRRPPVEIALAAKSPLTLARYVASHKVLDWKVLQSVLSTQAGKEYFRVCGESEEDPCSVEIETVLEPAQTILILQAADPKKYDVYVRYLQKKNGDWQFTGTHEAMVGEYPRRHEFAQVNGKPFLKVASDHTQIGIALLQEVEDWFDLTQLTFQPVFSFTRQGSYEPFSEEVGRAVRAWATPKRVDGVDAIDVTLTVTFNGPDVGVHVEFEGIYKRSSGARIFSLQAAYSNVDRRAVIPLEDFAGLGGVDFDEISNERLVFYAFPGLKKIASGPNKVAREWLRFVLGNVGDTPEKRALTELFAH